MRHSVFLALGTNMGDREGHLRAALRELQLLLCVRDVSPIYETPPWGYLDQPAFLNQVVKAETDLSSEDLLATLQALEICLGREKTIINGPRVIDLDIIFYDHLVYESPDLVIPHPRLSGRGFVLVPLADLAADYLHPILHKTVQQMLEQADVQGIHRFYPHTPEDHTMHKPFIE